VTRFGGFSHIGRLFSYGGFLKITEVAHIFGYFIQRLILCINYDKNGTGYVLGDFFKPPLVTLIFPFGLGVG
jgi:hypothetical protein